MEAAGLRNGRASLLWRSRSRFASRWRRDGSAGSDCKNSRWLPLEPEQVLHRALEELGQCHREAEARFVASRLDCVDCLARHAQSFGELTLVKVLREPELAHP